MKTKPKPFHLPRSRPITLRSVCEDQNDETRALRLALYSAYFELKQLPKNEYDFIDCTLAIVTRAIRGEGGAR